jgi:hypothetical protein
MSTPGLHLGRSADAADAVAKSTVIDAERPTLAIKVTNQTGAAAQISGWLNGSLAQADVPGRSGTVVLRWPSAPVGPAKVKLSLRNGSGPADDEEAVVHVKARQYGPVNDGPVSDGPVSDGPANDLAGPVPLTDKVAPGANIVTTGPLTAAVAPAIATGDDSTIDNPIYYQLNPDTGELLALTGVKLKPYVILGGGMLGFGLFILGASWLLGRRSPTE